MGDHPDEGQWQHSEDDEAEIEDLEVTDATSDEVRGGAKDIVIAKHIDSSSPG